VGRRRRRYNINNQLDCSGRKTPRLDEINLMNVVER
jgi:hypothetical protein